MATSLQTITDRIKERSYSEGSWLTAAFTGIFAGSMMVIMTVTYASLIFSGDLNKFVGQGVAIGLTGVIVVGAILCFFSRSSHLVIQIDDDTAPVFALLLTILAASLPADLSDAQFFANLLAVIFVATAIAGLVLAFFGIFRFGNLVQFLPYSVMGGYFAAVGWLLLVGTIVMLTGESISSLSSLGNLFDEQMLPKWLPAVIGGLWLYIMDGRYKAGPLLVGTVVVCVIGFYLVHFFLGNTPAELMQQGLLIGPFGEQDRSLLMPISSLDWSSVEWPRDLASAGGIASITLISLLSIILCISGLSLTTRRDLDINHELKVAGIANMFSGAFGGMAALPSLSISTLAHDIHPGRNRLIGLTAVLVGIMTFYFGMDAVAHMPKFVLGAISIYIGLGFVKEWLIDGLEKFGAFEYSVIPIILVSSIFAGFLQGVVVGVVASIILFVIKYSRIKIIRYQVTGRDLRSNLTRDVSQNIVLQEYGDQIRIFTLQGYLFFGTAGALYRTVLDALEKPAEHQIRFVILDFTQVIGADSSATLNFEKLAQRLVEKEIYLIATSLKQEVLSILRRGGMDLERTAYLIQHPDLDRGMEWCENQILEKQKAESSQRRGVFERMSELVPDQDVISRLSKYLIKKPVEKDQILTRMGEESTEVFFLESCTASAYIYDSEGQERRVSGAGRGAIYGEIGFLLHIPRTALVRADSNGEIYSLSQEGLTRMETEEPELASALLRYLAQTVTERLVSTTQALRSVI